MTHTEALKRCRELQAGTCDHDVRWIPRQRAAGDWTLARVRIPGLPQTVRVLGSAQQSPPRPQAPDPRPLLNPLWGQG